MSISGISSRLQSFSVSTLSSVHHAPEAGPSRSSASGLGATSSGSTWSGFSDGFDAGSATGPGSRAFGEKLESALRDAGLDDSTIQSVMKALNGGKAKGSTDSDTSEVGSVDGPGSRAFGDKLGRLLQGAGLDEDTVKGVLSALNGGKARGESSDSSSSGLTDLLSGWDDSSLSELEDTGAIEQLASAPELAAQFAQNPGLLQLMMAQQSQ